MLPTITSVSGGKTSAYLATKYPSDHLLFALVTTDDPECKFPDDTLRRRVSDRIGREFVVTLEDDTIIHTIFDLEQFIGRPINWVAGLTFDELIANSSHYVPNIARRFCTTKLKLDPMFYWCAEHDMLPCIMQIGFRANEIKRASSMMSRCNENGFIEFKATFERHTTGRHVGNHKWQMVEWQSPTFPLINDGIFRDHIESFWSDKPVRFAPHNNCVHCFHRSPVFLKHMYNQHPAKIDWAARIEGGDNGYWKKDVTYEQIKDWQIPFTLFDNDFTECDSGYCGL